MRWTLQTMLVVAVGFGAGCGDITVVDNSAVGDDHGAAARGDVADGGQPVVAACSAMKKCDDGDVCNLINGTCVECLRDGDCHSGKHSRCDTARFVCRECLSDDDCDDDKRCNAAGECK